MNAKLRKQIDIVALVSVVAVSGLVGAAVRYNAASEARTGASTAVAPATPAAVVGTPTGEIDRGMPVYRLPTVEVTVTRSEALARIAREEALAAK